MYFIQVLVIKYKKCVLHVKEKMINSDFQTTFFNNHQ